MAKTIFEYDFTEYINKMHLSKSVKPNGHYKVALSLDDKVLDALEKSKDRDYLAIRFVEKAQKICETAAAEMVVKWKELDSELAVMQKQNKLTKQMGDSRLAAFSDFVKLKVVSVQAKLRELPEDQWKKFLVKYGAAKQEYKNYKVNAATNMTIGTLGVIGSAAALAGTVHTGGASLVLGAIGMARSVVKITETVYSLAVDVEKQAKGLQKSINDLVKGFNDSKAKQTLKDLGKSTLNTIVGGQFITTVSNVSKETETVAGKAAGTYVGGIKLSQKVTETLKEMDKLQKSLATGRAKKPEKVLKELTKLQSGFGKLFDKAADLNAKAQRVEKELKDIKAQLKILKDTTIPLAIAEKAIDFLFNLGLAAGTAAAGLIGDAKTALEIGKEAVVLTSEILKTAKEELE